MRRLIPRAVVATAAVLFALFMVSQEPANLNMMLVVAVVVPVAVIGALELPRLFRRHL
jgi:hypothetical protein